ncbi:hypothetical protein CEE37_11345, partial [candidate division LCP-89 bacterium B3_LCP]
VFGETHIGGSVSGVWTEGDSPYIVESTLTIESGDTLIIQPRVAVQFTSNDTLRVFGTLLAKGAAGDSIFFVGSDLSSWKGIWFYNETASTSELEYVSIERPLYGVRAQYCSPLIRFCTIKAHSAGVYAYYADFELFECDIDVEGLEVNGVRLRGSNVSVNRCNISAKNLSPTRLAVGIRAYLSEPEVYNSTINVDGVGISFGCWLDYVDKAVFSYNLINVISQSQSQGVFLFESRYPVFVNNTIAVASGHYADKCIYAYQNSHPTIENCILYGDKFSNGVVASDGCNPLIGYTDIYNHTDNLIGCSVGPGCISQDPLFVDSDKGDFNLMVHSPCIDAGNPAAPFDPDNTVADMGCYPVTQVTYVPPQDLSNPLDYYLVEAYPNPFNPTIRLQINIPTRQEVNLSIYNLNGELVREIVASTLDAGMHHFTWNAVNSASGIYWAVLATDETRNALQLIRLK